jgi:hypothetical protein
LDKFEKTPSASNIILLGHCSVARVFWNLLVFSFANSKWGCPKFGNPPKPTIRLSLFLESGKTGRLHFSVWINHTPRRFHPRHDWVTTTSVTKANTPTQLCLGAPKAFAFILHQQVLEALVAEIRVRGHKQSPQQALHAKKNWGI